MKKIIAISAILFVSLVCHAEVQYTISDLGDVVAIAINDSGQIAGTFEAQPLIMHAFLYDGVINDIGALAVGTTSNAWDINNSGHVVGDVWPSDGPAYAFLYDGAEMTNIGTLGGARGINDSRQVAGQIGGTFSEANAINNSGQVVGKGNNNALLYDNGTVTNLGTLGGSSSEATDINNNGLIVGNSNISGDSGVHAFLYNNDLMTDLGTLGGADSWSWANGINDSGLIVRG